MNLRVSRRLQIASNFCKICIPHNEDEDIPCIHHTVVSSCSCVPYIHSISTFHEGCCEVLACDNPCETPLGSNHRVLTLQNVEQNPRSQTSTSVLATRRVITQVAQCNYFHLPPPSPQPKQISSCLDSSQSVFRLTVTS